MVPRGALAATARRRHHLVEGALVARQFIESHIAHPFIARLLQGFIAIAPTALVLTAFFGDTGPLGHALTPPRITHLLPAPERPGAT